MSKIDYILRLISVIYFFIGAYHLSIFIIHGNWLFLATSLYLIITSASIFFKKLISKYLVWTGFMVLLLSWLFGLLIATYYGWKQYDFYTNLFSVVLGGIIVVLALISSFYVSRHVNQSDK